MKIVLAVHHFPPRYSAGAETYTFRLARWLQSHDHHVEVVCVEAIDRGRPGELNAALDQYEGIPVWRLSFNLSGEETSTRMHYAHPLPGKWFADYLQHSRPDLVHFQAGYLIGAASIEASVAASVPTVLTLHDYWFLCPRITLQRGDGSLCRTIPDDPAGCAWCMLQEKRRFLLADQMTGGLAGRVAQSFALNDRRRWVATRRERLTSALALPDAVIAPSRFLAEHFAPFVRPERLHVSGLGLDLGPFRGGHRPVTSSPSGGVKRIGFIGQITPIKGVHLLIEAFKLLRAESRPIELHIYGGLDAKQTYARDYINRLHQLAENDARIHFEGRFENARVAEVLSGLDVTVVPSTWYENSPLAILESRAAGVPVVTAALGGMAELVRDGVDGLHFRPGDAADLARQLQRLLDEPDLLPHLRAGVVRNVPRSIEDEMQQLMGIYQNLVSQPTHRNLATEVAPGEPALGEVEGLALKSKSPERSQGKVEGPALSGVEGPHSAVSAAMPEVV